MNVINTFKFIPDLETWSRLDPEGNYLDVYNRCAWSFISIDHTVTQPVFELMDQREGFFFRIRVNPDVFPYEKWGTEYIVFARKPCADNPEQLQLMTGGEVWPFWFYTINRDSSTGPAF